ncbi:hypothetical protein Leryth_003231 [Lithospermum erythrorhizon]|nr:hypothetical protein Leryth_003231 [Lithospermum erythrorhizon]
MGTSNNYPSYTTSRREFFTIWMKSLVFHGNGCTVYDSNGQIVYRIDNYDQKGNHEVSLMDLHGNVLFSIRQKRAPVFRHWDGYKWNALSKQEMETPWFQVRKDHTVLRGDSLTYHVTLSDARSSCLRILAMPEKSDFKIVDGQGKIVAQVNRKLSSKSGADLGDDVLSLVVEPHVDHSLIMALVTVCNLSLRKF